MNWLTYKSLPADLKEEYRWKFYDRQRIDLSRTVLFATVVCSLIVIALFVAAEKDIPNASSLNILGSVSSLAIVTSKTVILMVCLEACKVAYYVIMELLWLRKHKIKSVNWWSKEKVP